MCSSIQSSYCGSSISKLTVLFYRLFHLSTDDDSHTRINQADTTSISLPWELRNKLSAYYLYIASDCSATSTIQIQQLHILSIVHALGPKSWSWGKLSPNQAVMQLNSILFNVWWSLSLDTCQMSSVSSGNIGLLGWHISVVDPWQIVGNRQLGRSLQNRASRVIWGLPTIVRNLLLSMTCNHITI